MKNALDEFERSLVAASRKLHAAKETDHSTETSGARWRRRPRRTRSRRPLPHRRLLVPIVVVILAAGGVAAAHSLIWPAQQLADGTVNCIKATSGQPPAPPSEYKGVPLEGPSLDGGSPISYCRLVLTAVNGRETPAGRRTALVACEANATTVDVYLASGATNQCQANGEKALPRNFAVAQARLRTLQQDLTRLDRAQNCASTGPLTAKIRSVLSSLGLVGWHFHTFTPSQFHGYAIPAGTGGTCANAGIDTQHQEVQLNLVPPLSVQKELQHVSYELNGISARHCYTATTIRTLVAKWFATIGMVAREATVSGENGVSYEPASTGHNRSGCVRYSTAFTGNNNRFADVELFAKGAPRLPAGQFFPPGKDFKP